MTQEQFHNLPVFMQKDTSAINYTIAEMNQNGLSLDGFRDIISNDDFYYLENDVLESIYSLARDYKSLTVEELNNSKNNKNLHTQQLSAINSIISIINEQINKNNNFWKNLK